MTSVDDRFTEYRKLQTDMENLADELRDLTPTKQNGGNGGGGQGLEPRVARLEGRVDTIIDQLGEISTSLARIETNVSHLPGKGYIQTAVVGALTLLGLLIIFADKIQALFGTGS